MKIFGLGLLCLLGLGPTHAYALDLELSSEDYASILSDQNGAVPTAEGPVEDAIKIGNRLFAWIKFENTHQTPDHAVTLTSDTNRGGIPIENAFIYSPEVILNKLTDAFAITPPEMKTVLLGTGDFPAVLPIPREIFVKAGLKLERVYELAARWKINSQDIPHFQRKTYRDVRGYYFLKKEGWDEKRLSALKQETLETQTKVKSWLKMECLNGSFTNAKCTEALKKADAEGTLWGFHQHYLPYGIANWNSFFSIPDEGVRKDLTWTSDVAGVLSVPFMSVGDPKIENFLSSNIEDEWKTADWNLRLKFGTYAEAPHVEFEADAVPHANAVGGNIITLDQNMSLDEFDSKWTIRHEFGHILGFPDCYLEFYDEDAKALVNYQLDTTDLMCSYSGNFKPRLYDELKRVYFKNTSGK